MQPGAPVRRLRRLQEGDRQRRRRGAALHAAALPAACTCRPRSRPASTSSPRSRCAVDAPGVRSVLETCEQAKKKNLSVVSGLCLRYDNGFRETVRRIHDGAIGDVVTLFRPTTTAAAAGPSRGSRTGPT